MIEQAIFTYLDAALSPSLGENRVFLSCCPDLRDAAAVIELERKSDAPVCRAGCTVRCFAKDAASALSLREEVRPLLRGRLPLTGENAVASPDSAGMRYLPSCNRYEGWVGATLTWIEEEQHE